MANTKTAKESFVFWQEGGEDGVPESTILVEANMDYICLETATAQILLNYESLNEFIAVLKKAKNSRL